MRFILFSLGVLAFLSGCLILQTGETAIHEIEAFIILLIAAVLIGSASVVEAIVSLQKHLKELLKPLPSPIPGSNSEQHKRNSGKGHIRAKK